MAKQGEIKNAPPSFIKLQKGTGTVKPKKKSK